MLAPNLAAGASYVPSPTDRGGAWKAGAAVRVEDDVLPADYFERVTRADRAARDTACTCW